MTDIKLENQILRISDTTILFENLKLHNKIDKAKILSNKISKKKIKVIPNEFCCWDKLEIKDNKVYNCYKDYKANK